MSLFTLCTGSLLALILIGRVLQLRELFLGMDVGVLDMGLLFFYLGPFFLLLIIPISCMLSVFLTFLRMSTDRELVALKAGGVSLYQLLPAPVAFCLLCVVLNLFISLFTLSWGMENFRSTIFDIARNRARIVMQPGVFNQAVPNLTVFARQVDSSTGKLGGVMVEDKTRSTVSVTIVAPEGSIDSDPVRGDLMFRLQDGKIYRQQGQDVSVVGFELYNVRLALSQLFRGVDIGNVKPKELSWQKLLELKKSPGKYATDENFMRKIGVEIHKRWVLPLACIVLGLFAMPLACAFEGVQRQLGVVLALVNFLIYYTLFSVAVSVGESGVLSPAIGLWVPNGLFMLMTIVGMVRAAQERSLHIVDIVKHAAVLCRFRKKEEGDNVCHS